MQRVLVWRLSRAGISPNGIPVRAEVPVLADAQAAGQLRKLLHQFRAEGRLARAPLIAPHGDGLGSAGAKAQSGRTETADINIVIANRAIRFIFGSFRGAAELAFTCAVHYRPWAWLPIAITMRPAGKVVSSTDYSFRSCATAAMCLGTSHLTELIYL